MAEVGSRTKGACTYTARPLRVVCVTTHRQTLLGPGSMIMMPGDANVPDSPDPPSDTVSSLLLSYTCGICGSEFSAKQCGRDRLAEQKARRKGTRTILEAWVHSQRSAHDPRRPLSHAHARPPRHGLSTISCSLSVQSARPYLKAPEIRSPASRAQVLN